MKYIDFEVSIVSVNTLKFLSVVAIDQHAAITDVKEMYGDEVEIVCICVK